jgi:hypothetical protein
LERQNITLSLKKELIKKAKIIAIQNNTSLSKLLADLIEKKVSENDEYARAQDEQLKMMQEGFDMALDGSVGWRRDELHER